MSDFVCKWCFSKFKRRCDYDHHITKGTCKDTTYICNECNKRFTTSNSMYRHMKHSCKVKKKKEDEKKEINDNLVLLRQAKKLNNEEINENELEDKIINMMGDKFVKIMEEKYKKLEQQILERDKEILELKKNQPILGNNKLVVH